MFFSAGDFDFLFQGVTFLDGFFDEGNKAFAVKVGIGDGGKQRLDDKKLGFVVPGIMIFASTHAPIRDALAKVDQKVLQSGDITGLAAHAPAGTASVFHRFLTLVTEHFHF